MHGRARTRTDIHGRARILEKMHGLCTDCFKLARTRHGRDTAYTGMHGRARTASDTFHSQKYHNKIAINTAC